MMRTDFMNKTAAMIGAAAAAFALAGIAQAQPAPDRAGQAMARMQGVPLGGRMMERLRDRATGTGGAALLRAADENRDGVATRAEIDALLGAEFAWRDRNGDGVLDAADQGPMAQRLAEQRAARPDDPWAAPRRGVDGDGDRQVTRAEMTAQADDLFARLDADSDGAITAEEARDARAGRRGRRGDQGGQP
jgi:hypothetical protein